jgi:hypothetical protein
LAKASSIGFKSGQVRRARQERVHPFGVFRKGRMFRAADPRGLERAPLTPALRQLDHDADPHLALGGSRAARQPCRAGAHAARARKSTTYGRAVHAGLLGPAARLNHHKRTL